jgi:hypothetical protein
MLWRKFKLDWQYAIGELLIVVAGVLIALAIDQWNDERLERKEADVLLQHLLIDLRADLNAIQHMVRAVEHKEQSLSRLKSVFDSGRDPRNGEQFLQDIVVGANFGWNQARPNDTTYEEALSSGKFGLIRDSVLRSEISGYYFRFNDTFHRADERETAFPSLSFQLVPRSSVVDDPMALLQTEHNLSADEMTSLVERALRSPLREHVIAEANLARFILHLGGTIRQRCEALIAKIEAYRASN